MTCRCGAWRDLGGAWFKTCWPRTSKGENYHGKRMEASIHRNFPAANPVYSKLPPKYHFDLKIYESGKRSSVAAISGTPARSLAEAKKQVAALLADECRFRGFAGVRRGRR